MDDYSEDGWGAPAPTQKQAAPVAATILPPPANPTTNPAPIESKSSFSGQETNGRTPSFVPFTPANDTAKTLYGQPRSQLPPKTDLSKSGQFGLENNGAKAFGKEQENASLALDSSKDDDDWGEPSQVTKTKENERSETYFAKPIPNQFNVGVNPKTFDAPQKQPMPNAFDAPQKQQPTTNSDFGKFNTTNGSVATGFGGVSLAKMEPQHGVKKVDGLNQNKPDVSGETFAQMPKQESVLGQMSVMRNGGGFGGAVFGKPQQSEDGFGAPNAEVKIKDVVPEPTKNATSSGASVAFGTTKVEYTKPFPAKGGFGSAGGGFGTGSSVPAIPRPTRDRTNSFGARDPDFGSSARPINGFGSEGFGSKPVTVGGGFGSNSTTTGRSFGASAAGGSFGASSATTGGFGAGKPATGGSFGASGTGGSFGASSATTGGFGAGKPATGGRFGASSKATEGFGSRPVTVGTGFGVNNTGSTLTSGPATIGRGFGPSPATGGFGSSPAAAADGFGSRPANTGGGFGTGSRPDKNDSFGGGFGNTTGGAFGSSGFKPGGTSFGTAGGGQPKQSGFGSSGGGFGATGTGFGSSGGGGESDMPRNDGCRRCGQSGHFHRECTAELPPRDTKCRNCGEEGHFSKECEKPRVPKCFNCGQPGHTVQACTQPIVERPPPGPCRHCEDPTHWSRDCPNKPPRVDEDGNPIPPPPPAADHVMVEEEELFKISEAEPPAHMEYGASVTVTSGKVQEINNIKSFEELKDIPPQVMENMKRMKWGRPTDVQVAAFNHIYLGDDLLACANTGCGKTGAYLLPIISRLVSTGEFDNYGDIETTASPRALILVPTRELALQIHGEARKLAYKTGVTCRFVYGGINWQQQATSLSQPDGFEQKMRLGILVATVGRLQHLLEINSLKLDKLKYVILDEADRMSAKDDFGEELIKLLPDMGNKERTYQMAMFSASFGEDAQTGVQNFLKLDYAMINVEKFGMANKDIEQQVLMMESSQKRNQLFEILGIDVETCSVREDAVALKERTLIFVNSKTFCSTLACFLANSGVPTRTINSTHYQEEREKTLKDFRQNQFKILVASNVASRGLDIRGLDHVINYDLPSEFDEYVNRIGRTGRAGFAGRSTSFFTNEDIENAPKIIKVLQDAEQKVPVFLTDCSVTNVNEDADEEVW